MEPLRVLIADDHPLFRHGLSALLTASPDFEVAGEATTGEEVIELSAKLQPDVILMDIQMPGVNGIEDLRRDIVLVFQKIIARYRVSLDHGTFLRIETAGVDE